MNSPENPKRASARTPLYEIERGGTCQPERQAPGYGEA